jgi:hypothetical protein
MTASTGQGLRHDEACGYRRAPRENCNTDRECPDSHRCPGLTPFAILGIGSSHAPFCRVAIWTGTGTNRIEQFFGDSEGTSLDTSRSAAETGRSMEGQTAVSGLPSGWHASCSSRLATWMGIQAG